MARTNMRAHRVKPVTSDLLTLEVLDRRRISPHFARIRLGGGEIARFTPMGFDQWFRIFLPVEGGTLEGVPRKLNTLSYLRFMTIAKTRRPVLRNYTVRDFLPDSPDGPAIEVDVVLHGAPGDPHAGPASTWAQSCSRGDVVGLLDEGLGFNPPEDTARHLLVADESGLPAVAGILACLPPTAKGLALLEIPDDADRQELSAPPGFTVSWLPRSGEQAGALALRAATELPVGVRDHGWVVGEQGLATGVRRHWVAAGLGKERVTFCGYWRRG